MPSPTLTAGPPLANPDLANYFPPAKLANVGDLLSFLIPIIMTVATLMLLVVLGKGAIAFLRGGGTPESFEQAKKHFFTAAAGFLLMIAAYLIVRVLAFVLGVDLPF